MNAYSEFVEQTKNLQSGSIAERHYDELKAVNRRLCLEIVRLQEENARLTVQNRELRELVAEYENRAVEA